VASGDLLSSLAGTPRGVSMEAVDADDTGPADEAAVANPEELADDGSVYGASRVEAWPLAAVSVPVLEGIGRSAMSVDEVVPGVAKEEEGERTKLMAVLKMRLERDACRCKGPVLPIVPSKSPYRTSVEQSSRQCKDFFLKKLLGIILSQANS
jgi:hypothetical protein